jgi:hypothetical protein
MPNSSQFYSYRLTNLPNQLQESEIREAFVEDLKLIKTISLASCPHQPSTFNVATITFDREPSFEKHLINGEGRFPSRDIAGYDQINIDNTFYGLTPLNKVSRTVRAEYGISYNSLSAPPPYISIA